MRHARIRDLQSANPTGRFTGLAIEYVRARPDYPPELLAFFQRKLGLSAASRVADIGAGTGLLTQLLLKSGADVTAVEPNKAMRAQCQAKLGNEANFRCVAGTAEATGLPDHSMHLITAGQAFHWFDRDGSRMEFSRILAAGGWVALVWNERRLGDSAATDLAFTRAFEELSERYRPADLKSGTEADDRAAIADFFKPAVMDMARFDHFQMLDFETLSSLMRSRSHSPLPGDERYEPMMRELYRIFEAHSFGGQVRIAYDTRVYYGRVISRHYF